MTRNPERINPVRIVFIITGLGTGGAEMMLLKLVENLDERFIPCVISLTTIGPLGEKIREIGVPVEAVGMSSLLQFPSGFLRLFRQLKNLRPDIVHTWMYHADLFGGVAARLAGVRSVAWGIHHSNLSSDFNSRATLVVARLCALLSKKIPDKIFACSDSVRDEHSEYGYARARIKVIPNGIDVKGFIPDRRAYSLIRRELKLAPNTALVGCIGRFHPQKNHAGFFSAMAQLHKSLPGVHYLLAGNGLTHSNRELFGLIEKFGLIDRVHLLGVRSDMPLVMASLDVLVSTSFGEAFSIVLAEAMSCGVPCVVTERADPARIVKGLGITVMETAAPREADMETKISQAIIKLLKLKSDEKSKLKRACRKRIVESYSIERIARIYEDEYTELFNR